MAQTQLNAAAQIGGNIAVRRADFTATQGQTSFALVGDNFSGFLSVYVGGSLLKATDDYTISGTTTVILNTAVDAGVIVTLQWFQPSFNLGASAASLNGFTAQANAGPNVLVATDSESALPLEVQKRAALVSMLWGK